MAEKSGLKVSPRKALVFILRCREDNSKFLEPCRKRIIVVKTMATLIFAGDYREEATLVPIPNAEAKLFNADGASLAAGEQAVARPFIPRETARRLSAIFKNA